MTRLRWKQGCPQTTVKRFFFFQSLFFPFAFFVRSSWNGGDNTGLRESAKKFRDENFPNIAMGPFSDQPAHTCKPGTVAPTAPTLIPHGDYGARTKYKTIPKGK